MSERLPEAERRRLLALVGSGFATGLAGCGGNGGDGGDGGGGGGEDGGDGGGGEDGGDGGGGEDGGGEDGGDGGASSSGEPVPSEYETATSLDGTERDPGSLSPQEDVNYQDEPNEGQRCADCRFYIEDMNGDGFGACAIVEGTINPEGWCVSFAEYQG